MTPAQPLEEMVSELERVRDRLVDLAMDSLRGALDYGDEEAAAAVQQERVINRARSSLDKAVRLLRSLSGDRLGEEDSDA